MTKKKVDVTPILLRASSGPLGDSDGSSPKKYVEVSNDPIQRARSSVERPVIFTQSQCLRTAAEQSHKHYRATMHQHVSAIFQVTSLVEITSHLAFLASGPVVRRRNLSARLVL